jgi:hypothetical protein
MRRSTLLPTAVLAGSLGLGCSDHPDVAGPIVSFAKTSGQSVSGHVERVLPPSNGNVLEKYSFHAHNLGNGTVQGQFEIMDIFPDGSAAERVKGRVTCFTVEADGTTARLGGIVESSNDPTAIGTEAAWTVADNGEGANAPPDQATDLRYGLDPQFNQAAIHCEEGFPTEVFGTFGESLRANVQVRP